ncbi:MAG TPA: bifunctional O-acetylhomoserine aminocarboxypropyltransferase/cysteine synthase [Desulfobacteraceae bacterium]|nr:bifunctional O-acetylhomoserine aminocarboxypropyltransferase/cysteine synthase [Desulfobacteraceae bacterium]
MAHRFNTLALHGGIQTDDTGSRGVPLHRTSAYLFKNTEHAANLFALKELGNIYTRLQNPTQDVLEKRVAALDNGAAALALSSGTAAIFYTIINVCGHGDEVVSTANLYGGTFTMFQNMLPEMGIKVNFVHPDKGEDIKSAITDRTRLIFTEAIGNPSLDVTDIRLLAKVAQKHHLPLAVDATFTTPYLLPPIDHGAHIVIHSLTKWLGGHGTALGGIVVDSGTFDWSDPKFTLYNAPDPSYHDLRWAHDIGELTAIAFILRMRVGPLRNLGACISPDNAWLILQGIETLSLRMDAHCKNALKVARFLENHEQVSWVRYPGLESDPSHPLAKELFENGFGGMVVFGTRGGRAGGQKFINSLTLVSHLANVGDAKTLAIHPASTTHSQLTEEELVEAGVTGDMVRLSVGFEDINDILEDLDQALKA